MSNTVVVEVEERSSLGKNAAGRLRRAGRIPGIVYGLDRPSFPVVVDPRRLGEVLKLESGKNTVFNLSLAGQDRTRAAEFKRAAAVAKLYSSEAAVSATRIATQVFGGYGFMEEYPVARFYRDAKILEIGEGTSEVQRMLIARGLGLPVE